MHVVMTFEDVVALIALGLVALIILGLWAYSMLLSIKEKFGNRKSKKNKKTEETENGLDN